MHSTLQRIEEPRFDDDPHDAPIAPDVIPTAWVDRGPPRPANDATSRERLFAEIRSAHEAAAPDVETTFRADSNDGPTSKDRSTARVWIKRALTVFTFALVSALAAAAWKHHGNTATEAVASWVPLSGANSSTPPETAAAAEQSDAAPAQAADQPAAAAPVQAAATAATDAEQQIQAMARDLAAMSQQIVELKASIEQLKASQQAIAAAPAPAARAPAPKPPPRAAMLPPRPPPPPPQAPRQFAPSAQAAAVPPPSIAAPPPQVYQPPPQAVVQPNGEPVVRPPAPLPLLPDRQ